jgi:hypothetical protein
LKSKKVTIRIINLPSPSQGASRQMMKSSFFAKWINYKANAIGIRNLQQGENVKQYLALFPNLLNQRPTIQYRTEVYQMVLNNTIQLV